MAGWSGGGAFTRVHDWTDDETAGENIEAVRMDAEDDNFAGGIQACRAKNGENAATGDLPMGGNIHTGVGDGSASNHYASVGQVQAGGLVYAVSGGAANVHTLTLSPAITSYATGQAFTFESGFLSTGAVTMNVNSVGAKAIQASQQACTGGELLAGDVYTIVYDGTAFQLINPSRQVGAVAFRDTDQAVTAATLTTIAYDQEHSDYSKNPIHSTVSQNSRFTVTTSGIYMCTCWVLLGQTAEDIRDLGLYVNGGFYVKAQSEGQTLGPPTHMNLSALVTLTAGQYVEFKFTNYTDADTITDSKAGVHIMSF